MDENTSRPPFSTGEEVKRLLLTLHQVLVRARWLVAENRLSQQQIYDLLDKLEILPTLLIEPTQEQLELFGGLIADLGRLDDEFKVCTEASLAAVRAG